jgi:polysaccharide biosynthesis protein PslG
VDRRRLTLLVTLGVSVALVVGLSISLLGGVGTSSTQPANRSAPKGFFGIAQGIRLDGQDLQMMAATGVKTDRLLLTWGSVEPSQGSFVWGPIDDLVGGLASHGIRAVPTFWGSPAWVADTPAGPPLDSASDEQAWQDFLKAAVTRYGPGGDYWDNGYQQQFGADARPLPIQAWQIWNEPNLKKYFAPEPSAEKYARLLEISHDAIIGQDPQARIVLAGMPGFGKPRAWDFLDSLYDVPGIKSNFDVAALHPYATDVDELRVEMQRLRAVMTSHGDQDTPLWLTELGWGSAAPDRFGLSKGLAGQNQLLAGSFLLLLSQRVVWNVQRVFWFDWRDPIDPKSGNCSFCSSAGLLNYDRSPKPAYFTFKRFAAAP